MFLLLHNLAVCNDRMLAGESGATYEEQNKKTHELRPYSEPPTALKVKQNIPSVSQLSTASLSSPASLRRFSTNARKRSTWGPWSKMFRFFSASRKKYSYDWGRYTERRVSWRHGQNWKEIDASSTQRRPLTSVKYSILYMSFLKKQTRELR